MPSHPAQQANAIEVAPQSAVRQPVPTAEPTRANADKVRALSEERDTLTRQVTDLTAQLQLVERQKQQATTEMEQQEATAESNAGREHDTLVQRVADLSARIAVLQPQLDTARLQVSFADTELRNSRAKNTEYAARLDLLQAQLHSQETALLPSPDEVRSLVAARNLHIIDVYHSNAGGKRQRAFGRVFYVEGRSLVFYAYDLTGTHIQKNISFHLWGEKVGSKETTLSLGALQNDDPLERRWTLTCNDPKLLAKIDSVYVTAESPNKQHDEPRGARVLYAYFGSRPNHP